MGSMKKRTYDAIVIGSGISGGWAANYAVNELKNNLPLKCQPTPEDEKTHFQPPQHVLRSTVRADFCLNLPVFGP